MQAIDGDGLKEAIKRARERWEENKDRLDLPPQKGCEHCDYTGWVVKGGERVRCECEEDEIRKKKQKTIDELIERYRIGVRGILDTRGTKIWKDLPGQEGLQQRIYRYVERVRRGRGGQPDPCRSNGIGKDVGLHLHHGMS